MAYDSGEGEEVTRFITQKSYYRPSNGTVKHNAFMPPRNNQLSVYRTTGLQQPEVWFIGEQFVAPQLQCEILGKAVINSLVVYREGLAIHDHPSPHERHANVVGWDSVGTEVRLIAIKLADAAQLVLKQRA